MQDSLLARLGQAATTEQRGGIAEDLHVILVSVRIYSIQSEYGIVWKLDDIQPQQPWRRNLSHISTPSIHIAWQATRKQASTSTSTYACIHAHSVHMNINETYQSSARQPYTDRDSDPFRTGSRWGRWGWRERSFCFPSFIQFRSI